MEICRTGVFSRKRQKGDDNMNERPNGKRDGQNFERRAAEQKATRPVRLTLRAARVLRCMTQAQAAEAIGISANTLSSYENGKSYPDVPMLQKMEQVYGVRYDQLIFRPRTPW